MPLWFYIVSLGLGAVAVASFGTAAGMLVGFPKDIMIGLMKLAGGGLIVAFVGIGILLLGLLWDN